MAATSLFSLLLSIAALARAARHVERGLGRLAVEPFPCELKVTYGKGKDFDGKVIDSITLIADCKADVHDCWLDQPFLEKKDVGKTVSIQIEGKGEDKKVMTAGLNKLRTLRLIDELEQASYVGRTFTFRAKDAAGDEGSASVTIQEPAAAKATEEAAKEAGGLPCELTAVPVDLQGGGSGFKVLVKCTEDVSDLKLSVPRPYGDILPLVKTGVLSRLMIVDASKIQSRVFVLTGKSAKGEGSASVTAPEAKVEEKPAPEAKVEGKPDAKTESKPEGKSSDDVKEPKKPAKDGSLPCTLTAQEVDIVDGSGKGVEFTFSCAEEVANPKLKYGTSKDDLTSEQGLQGPLNPGVEYSIVLDKGDVEGKVFVFAAEAHGAPGATDPVTV